MKVHMKALSQFIALFVFPAIVHAECMSGVYAITKKEVIGAVSLDKYEEMDNAIRNNDTVKLEKMKADSSVASIPSGKKACVVDNAFYKYSKKISMPGIEVEYWVNQDSLTDIR